MHHQNIKTMMTMDPSCFSLSVLNLALSSSYSFYHCSPQHYTHHYYYYLQVPVPYCHESHIRTYVRADPLIHTPVRPSPEFQILVRFLISTKKYYNGIYLLILLNFYNSLLIMAFCCISNPCIICVCCYCIMTLYGTTFFHSTPSTNLMYVAMFEFSGAVPNSMQLVPDVEAGNHPFNTSGYVCVHNHV